MANPLTARLDKLETKLPAPERQRRVFRVVAGEKDKEAALALAREHGFDDKGSDDLLILRSIVVPEGQPSYSKAPRIQGQYRSAALGRFRSAR
jgi:hypothetical protein